MHTDKPATARLIEKGLLDAGALELIPEIFAPEAEVRGPIYTVFMHPLLSHDDILEHVVGNRTGFPDLNHAIHAQLVDGNRVITYFTVSGTNDGVFVGQPPTHLHMGGPGISVDTFGEDGLIMSSWQTCDRTLNFTQLGALPPGLLPDTYVSPETHRPPTDVGTDRPGASPEDNKGVVTRLYEAITDGKQATLDDLVSEDFVGRMAGLPGTTKDDFLAWAATVHGSLWIEARIVALAAQGDWVGAQVSMSGVHRGDILGQPATGQPVAYESVDTWKVVDGKVVGLYGLPDNFFLGVQVGAIVLPGAGG
jgi:predicted ester cyclase